MVKDVFEIQRKRELRRETFKAAWHGDVETVRRNLESGAISINERRFGPGTGNEGAALIHSAASCCHIGHTATMKLMLSYPDLDIEAPMIDLLEECDRRTAPYIAYQVGRSDLLELMNDELERRGHPRFLKDYDFDGLHGRGASESRHKAMRGALPGGPCYWPS